MKLLHEIGILYKVLKILPCFPEVDNVGMFTGDLGGGHLMFSLVSF